MTNQKAGLGDHENAEMTSCIALDDFLRALARTPRRSAHKSQKVKASLGDALESNASLDKTTENEFVLRDNQASLGTIGGDITPDHQSQSNHISAGAVHTRMASQVGEEHQAVSKRKPAAQSYSRKKRSIANETGRVLVSGDGQAQLPPAGKSRRKARDSQTTASHIRRGVVRKRRALVNELVLVNSIADYQPTQREPVDSDTAHDLIDDPILGSEELLPPIRVNSGPQILGLHPHNLRKPLSVLSRNPAKSKRSSPPHIDLSEFRIPIAPAKKACRAHRRGSGFERVVRAEVLPVDKARRYQKRQSRRGRVAMGELSLVTSGELRVRQADRRSTSPVVSVGQVPVQLGDRFIGPPSIPSLRPARQPRLQGSNRVSKLLTTADANIDPVWLNSPPPKKPQRRVSFARDPYKQSPPIAPRDSLKKRAVVPNGKRTISGGTRLSFSPPSVKRRETFDQEIFRQFARITAPARKKELDFEEDADNSNDENCEGSDVAGSGEEEAGEEGEEEGEEEEEEEKGGGGEEEEEEMLLTTDLSVGQVVTGVGNRPISPISLGDPRSQYSQPAGVSTDSSHGTPKRLVPESWRVSKPIYRGALVEVEEILDDIPDLDGTQLLSVPHAKKQGRTSSLSLLSSRQRISPPPTKEEMTSLDLSLHNYATRLHGHGYSNPS
ncbi:MAG: hypothetical protein M1839_003365 [Geoglossum umbratile]|nr:MAG: hypothetical protein M1839_003365 [Geoglossum umbratile]